MLNDPYFKTVRSIDDCYVIMSKNTKHYWMIKKTPGAKYLIHVFHKHSVDIPEYHKQRSVRSVKAAIQLIKSHDDYVLNMHVLRIS